MSMNILLRIHRRTPLDDAIEGKFWTCAKLLACYGAKHTVPWTEDVHKAIEETDLDVIREHVRQEKVSQQADLMMYVFMHQ